MRVTIITVCYNSAAVIRTAMESVLHQTWADIEYWVIDGGSTDGTVDVVRDFEPKFYGRLRWVSEHDCGMYDAINKGLSRATGDVIGLLNADDVLANDWVIERVAEAFRGALISSRASRAQGTACGTMSGTDAVYGDIRFVADRREVDLDGLRAEPTVRYYCAKYWRPWMLQWGFMPPHPSLYVRKTCFARLGVYATDYAIAADYALMIRFFRDARVKSAYLPMSFVDMRMGGLSTKGWASTWRLNREIIRANRESGYVCCLPMLVPKYAFKLFEFVGPWLARFSPRS